MELEQIKNIMDKNELFVRICAKYLNEYEHLVTDELMREITGGDARFEENAFAHFISSAFLDDDELEARMLKEYFIPSVKKISPDEYKANPYINNIPITDQKIGAWTLSYQKYAPYEAFVRDDFTLFDDYREVCNLGFFSEEYSFPTVFENGVEWMAIKPNEIETMKSPIEGANGRVVTFGLGMGYFAYMSHLKSSVSSVTVIERDKSVIELFKAHILPHFDKPEKIKIIEADAFEYAENVMPREGYDYAFVDLWHDTADGVELYIKMKKLEHLSKNTHFEYWIERSILVSIRKSIFYAIYESEKRGQNKLTIEEIEKRLEFDYLKEFVKFL